MEYDTALIVNAWALPPSIRHDVIFRVLDALPAHQAVTLVNDHDPKPLFYQLDAEKPGMFRRQPTDPPESQYFAVVITRNPLPGDISAL